MSDEIKAKKITDLAEGTDVSDEDLFAVGTAATDKMVSAAVAKALQDQIADKIPSNASCNKNWNWSGQTGQPTWIWGGNDATDMYVYNPSNFSVSHAKTADYASVSNSVNWNGINGVPLILQDKGEVTNAITQTKKNGIYYYGFNTQNAPNTDAGVVIAFEMQNGDETLLTFRIAITSGNHLFTSIYEPGITYGTWAEK
ncbi:MAG: hypothetical protein Q4C61_16240 [Lachnospiraceae bacterium]|nr:hypothetical protein [Lachnospiraceae bacterium]